MVKTNKEKLYGIICMIMLVAGFVYSIVLSFSWGNDPFDPMGTLSLLCENRKIYFWLWVLVDGGALLLNLNFLYKKYGGANNLIKALPVLAFLCDVAIALTLGHSVLDWNPKRIVHWVATGAYVVFLFLSVSIYALKNIKGVPIFRFLLISAVVTVLLFLVWFLAFGKSGMLEMVPRALLEIIIFTANFCLKEKTKADK